jgi:hypothetical protein
VGLTTTETIVTDARFSSCSDDYNSKSYLRRDWPSNTLMPKQFSPFPPHCLTGADTDLRVAAFAEDLLRDLPAPAYPFAVDLELPKKARAYFRKTAPPVTSRIMAKYTIWART